MCLKGVSEHDEENTEYMRKEVRKENEKSCVMKRYITCTLHQILLLLSRWMRCNAYVEHTKEKKISQGEKNT
jgi:hypothetical protein